MKFPTPFLLFNDLAGLDEPVFATFRLGGTWGRIVQEKDRVFLAHKHMIIGMCEVVRVAVGPTEDILRELAANSHIELALRAQQGRTYNPKMAPTRRFESLQKTYGPHKVQLGTRLSAVVLKR